MVINGYLSALTRPENAVYFFREVLGVGAITKEVLRQRTEDHNHWVDAYAGKRNIPMEWAEQGVRKEDYVRSWFRRMERQNQHWRVLHFQEPGAGPNLSLRSTQVPHRRSRLPHLVQTTQPLHALLLLPTR